MGAALGVETGIGQPKPLYGAAMEEEVLGDDLLDVLDVDKAVPDGLRIDHDDGAVLALVEGAGLVGPDMVLQAGFLMASLKADFSFLLPLGRQLGRGALSSRSLEQMKMWWSNFGTGGFPSLCAPAGATQGAFLRQCLLDAT